MHRRYLDTVEAAAYVRVSDSWLAHARLRKEGPRIVPLPTGRIVYDVVDLDKWMEDLKSPVFGRPVMSAPIAVATTKENPDGAPRRRRGRPTKAESMSRRGGWTTPPAVR